jgi:hypothetical protein
MIGVRIVNDMVMMNWMPTMAHIVRCQPGCTTSLWREAGLTDSSSMVAQGRP